MLINFEKLVNQIDNFSNIYLLNETNFVVTKDLEIEFRSLSYDENSFLIAPMHREPSVAMRPSVCTIATLFIYGTLKWLCNSLFYIELMYLNI